MKTIIYRGIDPFDEAVGLLKNLAVEERPFEIKRKLLAKYQIDSKTVEEPFAVWEELVAAGRERMKGQMNQIREYFSPYKEDGILCKASAVLLFDAWQYGLGTKERRQECLALTEEERSRRFYQSLMSGYGLDADVNYREVQLCKGLRDVLQCLDQSEYTPEQKWQLLWGFQHPKEAWEELAPLLEEAEAVIREKEALWRPLTEGFYQRWQERLKQQTPQEYARIQAGIALDENPLGIVVIPQILGAVQVTLAVKLIEEGWGTQYQDIFRVGVVAERIDRGKLMVETGAKRRQIAAMMKILSDESKLEILSLLKERRYYGGELARSLKLTTATISHHMSNLVSYSLVNVSKEGNRVYYELNESMIGELLNSVRELLLRDPAEV